MRQSEVFQRQIAFSNMPHARKAPDQRSIFLKKNTVLGAKDEKGLAYQETPITRVP
jgi:hypothetical protein